MPYPPSMARTDAVDLLRTARAAGAAVAAINAVNLESMEAVVGAAEDTDLPVILQVSQNAARYGGLTVLAAAARVLREEATVPVVLHFDHAESAEVALRAFDLGFDSVMLEGAGLPTDEHIAALQILAERARSDGRGVEAEAEITPKGERHGGARLTPAALAAFVRESGATSLAIDVGSSHKQRTRGTPLDLSRLEQVAAAVEVPLVLHGSSGVAEDDLLRAVRLGVAKVNIATALMAAFTAGVRRDLADPDVDDARRYLGAGRSAMRTAAAAVLRQLAAPPAPPSAAPPTSS